MSLSWNVAKELENIRLNALKIKELLQNGSAQQTEIDDCVALIVQATTRIESHVDTTYRSIDEHLNTGLFAERWFKD